MINTILLSGYICNDPVIRQDKFGQNYFIITLANSKFNFKSQSASVNFIPLYYSHTDYWGNKLKKGMLINIRGILQSYKVDKINSYLVFVKETQTINTEKSSSFNINEVSEEDIIKSFESMELSPEVLKELEQIDKL